MSGFTDKRSLRFYLAAAIFAMMFALPSDVCAQMPGDEMRGRYLLVYDSTYIWPDGRGGYDYTRKFISEVQLDERGRSTLSRPATPVLSRGDRIAITAFTRLPSGETLPADSSEIITRFLSGDRRWNFVNFRQPEPGAILHMEWLLNSNEASIAGKRFLGRTVPVEKAVIILTVPETWVFNLALSPGVAAETNRTLFPSASGPAIVDYSWIARDIPGLIHEEFSPPVERIIPCLYFSFYYDKGWKGSDSSLVDWAYLANLYGRQLGSFVRAASALNSVADSLMPLTVEPKLLATLAYGWLCANFRALDSDIALSNNVNDALQRGRGTEAEAAAILFSLLAKLNISCSAFLVATNNVGDPLVQVPALFWFDRLLIATYVGNDTAWIDPYYQLDQIGIIPFEDQGARALRLTGGTASFLSIPIFDFRANGKATHMKLNLDPSGSLQGEATEVYSGAMIPEISAFIKNLGESEREGPWKKKLASSFPSARIQRLVLMPPDSSNQAFRIGYSFTTGPIVRPFADRAYIPLDLLSQWADLPTLPNRPRLLPIDLRRPRFEFERITLEISSPFEVEYLPGNYSENLDIGDLYSVARGDKQSVTITRGFGFKRTSLPLSEYGSLRKFLDKAHAEADKHIILKRTD